MNIQNKKILITNYTIGGFSGSEINALSLAKTLRKMGAEVEVATLNYAFPLRAEYEKENLAVRNVFFDGLNYDHYDIIWAHHEVILSYLLLELNITADNVVYSSLSPFDPYEAAPAYADKLSLSLGNSDETVAALIASGIKSDKVRLFPNYVSLEFFASAQSGHDHAGADHLAVVSNHIPEEVLDAASLLKAKGISVDIYGVRYKEELVTADVLKKYDAVLSIGKTVQYAMALGIPIYCYDIHGGPGWILPEITASSFSHNFSGRGFGKKTSAEIADDITDAEKYREAFEAGPKLREFISENCILENNLMKIFDILKDCNQVISAESLFGDKVKYEKRRNDLLISLYRYNLLNEMNCIDLNEKLGESEALTKSIINERNSLQVLCDEKTGSIEALKADVSSLEAICRERERSAEKLAAENEMLSSRNRELAEQCSEKEENCRYLIELNELKDKSLDELKKTNVELNAVNRQNTMQLESRAWKYIVRYRLMRDGIKKAFRGKQPNCVRSESEAPAQMEVCEVKPTEEKEVPLVTIGIPVYDRTDQLVECIESLLNQTYENTEIIAVCDGSPKATLDIVKEYEAHGLIRAFYYKDNSGNAVRGRNKAIREAKGVYYAFMDSDDIALPDRIENSVSYLEKFNVDAVYGGWKALVDGSRNIDISDGQEVMSPDCDYEMLKNVCVPCQSTVMVKTAVLRDVGGLKSCMRYREDHELWLRMAYSGYRFKAIDKVLVRLRLHSGNLELSFTETDDKWFNLMQEEHKIIRPMKPKVAYVIPGCGISGGIAVICQHANRLRARGYDVLLITETEETEINWFPKQMVDVVTVKNAPDNIDCLVATGWSTAYTVQSLPAKKKYYFVQSDETRFNPEGSEAYNMALKSYSMDFRFITEARWIQTWLKEKFGKDAAYVPNGLDEEIIYCTEDRADDDNRKVRVLLEGPIDIPYKGMKDAFEAVVGLDCEVWCISSAGVPRPDWKCDRFFTKVPMEDMKNIYSKCDVLLKMSRVEGFFGPPMEMMACGGTCVVGKVTGYDEYIEDGYNALVVEQGDVLGAHNALKQLIENPEMRKRLAENGMKTVQDWKWNDSIDLLEDVLNKK